MFKLKLLTATALCAVTMTGLAANVAEKTDVAPVSITSNLYNNTDVPLSITYTTYLVSSSIGASSPPPSSITLRGMTFSEIERNKVTLPAHSIKSIKLPNSQVNSQALSTRFIAVNSAVVDGTPNEWATHYGQIQNACKGQVGWVEDNQTFVFTHLLNTDKILCSTGLL